MADVKQQQDFSGSRPDVQVQQNPPPMWGNYYPADRPPQSNDFLRNDLQQQSDKFVFSLFQLLKFLIIANLETTEINNKTQMIIKTTIHLINKVWWITISNAKTIIGLIIIINNINRSPTNKLIKLLTIAR